MSCNLPLHRIRWS